MQNATNGRPHNGNGKKYSVFENLLIKRRDDLRHKLNYRLSDVTVDREPDDEGDVALRNFTKDFAVATIERERRELAEVEAALKRISTGEYGTCEICENPIKEARLQALPWARLCIECAGQVSSGRADMAAD
jgi:DnaK suppressor protein